MSTFLEKSEEILDYVFDSASSLLEKLSGGVAVLSAVVTAGKTLYDTAKSIVSYLVDLFGDGLEGDTLFEKAIYLLQGLAGAAWTSLKSPAEALLAQVAAAWDYAKSLFTSSDDDTETETAA